MMTLTNTLLATVLLLNLFALGTSRINTMIKIVTIEGAIIGIMPLLFHGFRHPESILLALATLLVKAVLIPTILYRALREVRNRNENAPLLGVLPSMVIGALGTGLALVYSGLLPLIPAHTGTLLVPTSLATMLTGLILLTTRIKAISQALGYLVLENGIFIFSLLMLDAMPFFVEVGLLLDLFVGLFLIGIILNHISNTYQSLNTRLLTTLKEENPWPQD